MKKLLTFLTLLTLFFGVGWAETKTDVLNYAFTGISGTSYSEWSGKAGSASTAVYAGQSGGQYSTIQLRSNNNNSGVITTTSGGKVTKVRVDWYNLTQTNRVLNIYGKNTAYTAATDLYSNSTQGDLIGTLTYDGINESSTLTISGNYSHIGIRSASGAIYLSEIDITWDTGGTTEPDPTAPSGTISFNPAAGEVASGTTVSMTFSGTCDGIKYTTDGTSPSATNGTVYDSSNPPAITAATTITAAAYNYSNSTYAFGTEATASYTIEELPEVEYDGTATFNATVDAGTSPLSKYPVTFECSSGALNNNSEYRLYKNSTTTFTVPTGYKIVKIEFTGTSSNPVSGFGSTTGLTFNGNDGTWIGEEESVSFTASGAQVRCTLINVYYTAPAGATYYYLVGTFNMNGNDWVQGDADYMFTENNGVYELNGVDLPDETEFKIIKVQGNTTTWWGGNGGGSHYGLHSGHHTNINLVEGNDNFYLQPGAITNFSFTVDANNNPSVLNVNRDAQLFVKGDFNSWAREAMTLEDNGWTINKDIAATNQFGFINEWGTWYGGNGYWIYQANDMGNALNLSSDGNFYMVDAGNYDLTVNTALTTLTVTTTAVSEGDVYELVTSADDLVAGGEYIISGGPSGSPYSVLMGAVTTNGAAVASGFTYDATAQTMTLDSGCEAVVLTLGGSEGAWTFYTGSAYLSLTSSANNLNTSASADATNAKWTINADNLPASNQLISNNQYTTRYLQYNSGSPRFACYTSSQQAVALFKKVSSVTPSDQVATPVITPGSADSTDPYYVYGGKQEITISCATNGATIYYTTDGTDPSTSSTEYSAPFDLTSTGGNKTVKAIAVKTDLDDSAIAAAYYIFTNPNAPTFDPASGAVRTEAFDVTISSEYDDAVIYYMLDPESAPTAATMSTSGTVYDNDNPVNVSGEGSHTIYAMVIRNGIKSSVVNATYTITSGGSTTGDGDYVKVTTAADLTDGEYLIVYEGNAEHNPVALNGALSTLDAVGNNISVVITNNTIPSSDPVDAAVFTINVAAGTIMNNDGVYIGAETDVNTLGASTEILTNTISIDEDGNAVIKGYGGAFLRYNYASNQTRFRYYKSSSYTSQQPIALYKKVNNANVATPVITPGSKVMTEAIDAEITCATTGATIYYTLDGTDPTTSSAVYSEPIHIAEPTVTLKAIAEKDGELSSIATAVYSGVWVENIAEYNELPSGTEDIVFKNPVIVQYHYISGSKNYIYVKDDSGCAYFHQPKSVSEIAQLENGDIIGAGFYGDKTPDEMVSDEESNFFMLTNLVNFAPNGDKGLADPEHETVAHIADATTGVALNNHYITIKKVKLSALYDAGLGYGGAKYFDIDNEAHIGYNKFNIDYSVVDDVNAYYNITGIQTAYNNVMEFHPTEVVKWEETVVTLRQLCDEGVTTEGENEYTISNNLLGVYAYHDDDLDADVLWVKDDTGQSIWLAAPDETYKDNFAIEFEALLDDDDNVVIPANTRLEQQYYDQSNWCQLILTSGNGSAFVNKIIKGGSIEGKFTNKTNPTMTGVALVSEGENSAIYADGSYNPNYYIAANFYGNQSCNTDMHGQEGHGDYFFMTPKPQEYATIVWAVWDGQKMSMPSKQDGNSHELEGEFSIDLSMNQYVKSTSGLPAGDYSFHAIIRKAESGSKAADDYMVYPTDLDPDNNPSTAINKVETGNGVVKSVKYVNVAGMVSDTPFQGVNIVVTEYTDGTRTATKMLKK